MTLERSFARVLGKPFNEKCLASFVDCGSEGVCVNGSRTFDEDVQMLLVRSRLIGGGLCSGLDYY